MSTQFQLSGRLPKEELNGLADHEEDFLGVDAPEPLYGVVMIQRSSRTVKDDSGEVKAVAKISHIQIAEGQAADELARLLQELRDARTGDTPLPDVVEPEQDFTGPLVESWVEMPAQFGIEQ